MGAPKVKAGTVIAGRYRLVAPLSRGGMGSVWRAEHLSLGSPIAIKLIDADLVEHDEARSRFEQEARAAAALRSPHVVQILDHGVDRDLPFIAMELLDGESLATRLHRLGALPPAHTARIFSDLARAMKKAHDIGIIHRDLKPDNVFLVRNDDREIAKVLDFGIAKAQSPLGDWKGGGTRTGALIGTPQYMSPEQAQGLPLDFTSDLWALGVIAFECVCGRLPFPSENPGALILEICAKPMPVPSQIARVPARFDAWFARACQREPRARFASAKEMADTLAEVLGVAPAAAEISGPVPALSTLGPAGTRLPLGDSPAAAVVAAPVFGAPQLAGPPVLAAPAPASPPVFSAPVVAHGQPVAPAPAPGPMAIAPGFAGPAFAATSADPAGEGTMNGGAVVDSDHATLLRIPGSRPKRALIAAVIAAAALVSVALWWGTRADPASASSAPEVATSAPAAPPPLQSTDVVPAHPAGDVPSSSGSVASASSSALPLASAKASASGNARSGAPSGARGAVPAQPSATGSRKKEDRIGF